jgi:dTDP-4-amino-4,6-dideoxygalactose transaminase
MNNIKFIDLAREYKVIKKLLLKDLTNNFERSEYILGSKLFNFEKQLSKFLKIKYCAGVNSGTDALILILKALNIGHLDEVIVPAHTYASTAFACSIVGAKPIFVDININDFNINIAEVKKKISNKTKAVIAVHIYGQMADVSELNDICKKNKIYLIEDASQAHGAKLHNKNVGYYSDATALSFYPGKNLGAYGDGGAVITNNFTIFNKIKILRNIGSKKKYVHDVIGINSRLDDIQAIVLSKKLKILKENNLKRNMISKFYNNHINNKFIIKPINLEDRYHVYHLYVLRVIKNQRSKFIKHLNKNGIQTIIHYPILIANQKPYAPKANFPIANSIVKEIVSIPNYPYLKKKELTKIVKVINIFNA